MRTTIREVALQAGVSPKTVTNVLLERDARTSPQTRARVLETVRALNYVPVHSARQNRHIKTGVIGVAFHGSEPMQDFVGVQTFAGLRAQADAFGYDLLVLGTRPRWKADRREVQFLDRRADGYIFVLPAHHEVLPALVRHHIPVVACYDDAVPHEVPTVMPDDEAAMCQAVEHLMAQGHHRIAHLAGAEVHVSARRRRAGFARAMQATGLGRYCDLVVHGSWIETQINVKAAHEILDLRPSAVICGNDAQALTLWNVAEARGLQVPQQLSIIGMDDTTGAAQRGLTSLGTPFRAIGEAAVSALLRLLQGQSASELSCALPAPLTERASVGPPVENPESLSREYLTH